MTHELIDQIEALIRRDPAQRGLIASEPHHGPLCPGHLCHAAVHLAEFGRHVGLVTGFYVPHGDPPAAETDGPPGAVLLADALQSLGIHVTLWTDERCFPAVNAAVHAAGCDVETLVLSPNAGLPLSAPARTWSHLIAVERVGPSHTVESLQTQQRSGPDASSVRDTVEEFLASVPAESRGRCHNMRGDVIDPDTADLHRLFEELPQHRPEAKTIGIGDGGNEIGMGSIPWEELVARLEGDNAPRGAVRGSPNPAPRPTEGLIEDAGDLRSVSWHGRETVPQRITACLPCRVPTDWTIIAGTSNWGAFALAAAVLVLRNRVHVLRDWDRDRHQRILKAMVQHGPAVDGVTGRREPTVDGLPFITYIQPWEGIRSLLGFEP